MFITSYIVLTIFVSIDQICCPKNSSNLKSPITSEMFGLRFMTINTFVAYFCDLKSTDERPELRSSILFKYIHLKADKGFLRYYEIGTEESSLQCVLWTHIISAT